jgi:hypothetical protein
MVMTRLIDTYSFSKPCSDIKSSMKSMNLGSGNRHTVLLYMSVAICNDMMVRILRGIDSVRGGGRDRLDANGC